MFFSKLNKRERYIAYFAIVVVGLVILNKVVFSPLLTKLNNLNKKIAVNEKKLKKSLGILSHEKYIKSKYKKYISDIKQTHSEEEEIGALLSQIEKIGKKSSVFLADIKPDSVKDKGFYKKYIVRLEVEANMAHLADFIYKLEKSSRLLRVVKFSISKKEKGSTTLKARMTVTQILIL